MVSRAEWLVISGWSVFLSGMMYLVCLSPAPEVSNLEHKEGHSLISKMEGPPAVLEDAIPLPAEPEAVVVTARVPRYAVGKLVEGKYQFSDLQHWSLERYTVELVPGKKSPVFVYKASPYEYYGVAAVALADVEDFKVGKSRVLAIDREIGIGIVSVSHSTMQDQAVEIDKPFATEMLKYCGLPGTATDVFILTQLIYGR